MRKLFFGILALTLLLPRVRAQHHLGEVSVLTNRNAFNVAITGNPPTLGRLASFAFSTHGRYNVVSAGESSYYQMNFTLVGDNQVSVEIAKFHQPFATASATGRTWVEALYRAADLAVEKTNGLGLRGYFSSKLAFVGGSGAHKDVYIGDLFLTQYKRLTGDNADALFPRWSPDGTRLLYTSYRRGFPDIYEIDLRSYMLTTFESFKGTNIGARYSPDGRRVAMVLTGTSGNSEVYVSDSAGHGLQRLTHFQSDKASPCWSPDGTRIVFASSPGPQLYLMSALGGTPRRLTSGVSRYCAEPDWSRENPDKIAFSEWTDGGYQIGVISVSNPGDHKVASHAAFDGIEPCWLPDGRHLVYTARDSRHSVLCILDTETGKSTPITARFPGLTAEANVWSQR